MTTLPDAHRMGKRKSLSKKRRQGEAGAIRPKLKLVPRPPTLPHKPKPKRPTNRDCNDWPEPQSLRSELLPVPPFNQELLPDGLRELAVEIAESMQVPIDYVAVTIVMTMAGLTGRRVQIQPKAQDSRWIVVPNLWGAIIGAPGIMKSQIINEVTSPARAIEAQYRAAKGTARRSQRRLITSDATIESLHEIMSVNPAGGFLIRDELSGWFAGLERPGREQERSFFLESWDGNTPFTMDRIGRGTIHVEHSCISLFGSIQPEKLRSVTARNNLSDDGLIQRVQLMVWPDVSADFDYHDQEPDEQNMLRFRSFCRWITTLDGADPVILQFSNKAQLVFQKWFTDLEHRIRRGGLSNVMTTHLAKYRSLMPSLALLFSLFEHKLEPVQAQYARQAVEWCDYLELHARRVYGYGQSRKQTAAQVLAHHLQQGWRRSQGTFTLRDVYRSQWAGLSTKEEAVAALQVLENAKWVRRNTAQSSNGRPSERYFINPKIWNRDTGS